MSSGRCSADSQGTCVADCHEESDLTDRPLLRRRLESDSKGLVDPGLGRRGLESSSSSSARRFVRLRRIRCCLGTSSVACPAWASTHSTRGTSLEFAASSSLDLVRVAAMTAHQHQDFEERASRSTPIEPVLTGRSGAKALHLAFRSSSPAPDRSSCNGKDGSGRPCRPCRPWLWPSSSEMQAEAEHHDRAVPATQESPPPPPIDQPAKGTGLSGSLSRTPKCPTSPGSDGSSASSSRQAHPPLLHDLMPLASSAASETCRKASSQSEKSGSWSRKLSSPSPSHLLRRARNVALCGTLTAKKHQEAMARSKRSLLGPPGL